MKNYKKLIFALILTVLFQIIVFAQSPGDFGGEADSNQTDTPINSQLWVLVTIGLGVAFFKTKWFFQKK